MLAGLLICIFLSLPGAAVSAENRLTPLTCTYEMQMWNVNLKSNGSRKTIQHLYSELTPEETERMTGCTVCSEDQERINIPPLQPFSVCYRIAPQVIERVLAVRGGC